MARTRKLVLAAALAAAFTAHNAHAVPVFWSGNGHSYQVVTSGAISWNDARTATTGLGFGWDLASVTSAAEQAFIASLLPATAAQRAHYWLGGTDSGTEGDWAWVDGETWNDGVSYENWYGGEPNDAGGEDFLAMDYRSGWNGWNDAPGTALSYVFGYVMETTRAVPAPATLGLLGLALTVLGGAVRRRR